MRTRSQSLLVAKSRSPQSGEPFAVPFRPQKMGSASPPPLTDEDYADALPHPPTADSTADLYRPQLERFTRQFDEMMLGIQELHKSVHSTVLNVHFAVNMWKIYDRICVVRHLIGRIEAFPNIVELFRVYPLCYATVKLRLVEAMEGGQSLSYFHTVATNWGQKVSATYHMDVMRDNVRRINAIGPYSGK
jgi:hypothetical protein